MVLFHDGYDDECHFASLCVGMVEVLIAPVNPIWRGISAIFAVDTEAELGII